MFRILNFFAQISFINLLLHESHSIMYSGLHIVSQQFFRFQRMQKKLKMHTIVSASLCIVYYTLYTTQCFKIKCFIPSKLKKPILYFSFFNFKVLLSTVLYMSHASAINNSLYTKQNQWFSLCQTNI